jgi:hypothetical protein
MRLLLVVVLAIFALGQSRPPVPSVVTGSRPSEAAQGSGPSVKAVPACPQPPLQAERNEASLATANITSNNSAQTHNEDFRIQRKLAWFTGALVFVGILQTVVMFLTWQIYRRQANEMRRQRHEMRRQRHVMFRQWNAMKEQAKLMEGQLVALRQSGEQTDKLISHAEGQVSALLTSATAMQKSIALQEATLEQWVDIFNWQTDFIAPGKGIPAQMRIRVDVVNPTNFPLALEDAYIVFGDRLKYLFRDHCLLTPRNPYTVDVAITLDDEAWKHYWQSRRMSIRVEGDLSHLGSLRERRLQPFCGDLICAHKCETRFEFETPVPPGYNPYEGPQP